MQQKAQVDYFATSLPAMLLFEDDLQRRNTMTALFLQAQAWLGLGDAAKAQELLTRVLSLDPSHSMRSEEHTSELQSRLHLVCRLLLEKKKTNAHDASCTRRIL